MPDGPLGKLSHLYVLFPFSCADCIQNNDLSRVELLLDVQGCDGGIGHEMMLYEV